MGQPVKKTNSSSDVRVVTPSLHGGDDENARLEALGYKPEFAREFGNLSTLSFAASIMGVSSSVATTLNTPLLLGGPASAVWMWFLGSIMCFCLGTSIAEIISAYPTNGGLYSASAYLVPKKYKATVGWTVGWLNLLGQVAGVASTCFGLSAMILSAATIATDGDYVATSGHTVALFCGLLAIQGALNSFGTKILALITKSFIFVNFGSLIAIVIALAVTCDDKHDASYVFTETVNTTGWSSQGLAVLLGLLSVQWTMTDYDATAHISEEVKKAAVAAPVAIIVAVASTGVLGWIYNIIYVLCSGPMDELPGLSGYAAATIIVRNVGKKGFYVLWSFVCFTAFAVVSAALQATARTVHAFSRDNALPDRGFFAKNAKNKVPINAVWLTCFFCACLGMLDFAGSGGVVINAVFSLCAIALDSSYCIPIACKIIFRHHPEVDYQPGPFSLERYGFIGRIIPIIAIVWTLFVVVILALPESIPVTAATMNYSAPLTGAVILVSWIWYFAGARKHYTGPRSSSIETSESGSQDKHELA
ncbi:hypothetical protein JCM8547_006475 [Rhodosporidiobolus lusitaniae]